MSALTNSLVLYWLLFCILSCALLSRTEPQEFQRDHDRRRGPDLFVRWMAKGSGLLLRGPASLNRGSGSAALPKWGLACIASLRHEGGSLIGWQKKQPATCSRSRDVKSASRIPISCIFHRHGSLSLISYATISPLLLVHSLESRIVRLSSSVS